MASSIGNLEILPLAVRSHHPRTSQFQSPPSPEMEPPFKATPANTQEETQIQNLQSHSCNPTPQTPELEPPIRATPANNQQETQIQNLQSHSCNPTPQTPEMEPPFRATPANNHRKHKSNTSNPTAATQPHQHQKWSRDMAIT